MPTSSYRRNLPHIQRDFTPRFITFCTAQRWEIPEMARSLVLESCIYENQRSIDLLAAVVMPDHVHLIGTPLILGDHVAKLHSILRTIKSASAHKVNRALQRQGQLWQEESFDHIVRSAEGVDAKIGYILDNPVRRRIAQHRREYPWGWVADS